jgi:predicted Zn-dependent peptidase
VTGGPAADAGEPAVPFDLSRLDHLLSWTKVDGIPTLFAPREGPVTGGLVFRVGRADETLATSGITHLIEHLALYRNNLSGAHHNGQTEQVWTAFHATGTADEVVAHLNSVCASLRDLPLARLEVEKKILRTEAAGRQGGPFMAMNMLRYGAQGYGLSGYDELGVWRLGADEVEEWARTRFTRDNAVLFLTTGDVPQGLDLRLPRGERIAPPQPFDALGGTPAFFVGHEGGVVLDAVVDRSSAATVFAEVARRAIFDELRQKGGFSYTADADYSPRDGSTATITLYADALPEKQDAAVGAFVDTLARLRRGWIAAEEVHAARAVVRGFLDVPDAGATMLPAVAVNLLVGGRILSPEEHLAELDAVTVEDVQAVASQVWAGALVQVPSGLLDWAGAVPAPSWSDDAVSGESFTHLDHPDVSLVVGEDGVSVVTLDGPATVRFDECVAMETRPDGARILTGADGFRVRVEPTLYAGLTRDVVAARIDARLSRELVVPLPPREQDAIPRPAERVRPSAAARISRFSAPARQRLRRAGDAVYAQARRWSLSRVGYWLMWLAGFAGVQFGLYAVRILAAIRRGESDAVAAVVILGALCVALVGTLLYVTVRALLEGRRARGSRRR